MASIGLLCLRLGIAVVLVAHGLHKLFGTFAAPAIGPGGIDATTAQFAALGLQPAPLLAVTAGIAQLLGGVLIGLGWFTRFAAAANVVYMIVGIWKEHGQWGLFLNWTTTPGVGHGIEYSIVFACALTCLVLTGAGDLSFDGRHAKHRASRAAGRARVMRG